MHLKKLSELINVAKKKNRKKKKTIDLQISISQESYDSII